MFLLQEMQIYGWETIKPFNKEGDAINWRMNNLSSIERKRTRVVEKINRL